MRALILSIFFGFLLFKMYGYARVDIGSKVQENAVQNSSIMPDISSLNVQGFVLSQSRDSRVVYKIESSLAKKIQENVFSLDQVNAIYNLDLKNQVRILAEKGMVDQNKKIMFLQDRVNLFGEGYRLTTQKLEMDFDKSYIHVEDGVSVNYLDSQIQSDECIIFNNSKNIRCNGNIQANINFNGL